jgi:hypothetical protein
MINPTSVFVKNLTTNAMASVGITAHAPVHMPNVTRTLGVVNYARKASLHVGSSEEILEPGNA